MPYAAPTRCGYRDTAGHPCPEVATERGRCADHQRPPWQRRSKAWGKGSTRKQRAFRAAHLRMEPHCRGCGADGVEVDHITPLSRGGAEFDHANAQTLCVDCHKTKSTNENRQR
ncbi:HNH endonuclease [Streptomonospora salina]